MTKTMTRSKSLFYTSPNTQVHTPTEASQSLEEEEKECDYAKILINPGQLKALNEKVISTSNAQKQKTKGIIDDTREISDANENVDISANSDKRRRS